MRKLFKNFDTKVAVGFTFAMLGIMLFAIGGILAVELENYWILLTWLPAIVFWAVAFGLLV